MFSSPKQFSLNSEAFQRLMSWLDEDPEQAGEKYEVIRLRLITFFECHGSLYPEAACDETIDRVARRISEGEIIRTSNRYSYFLGVANLVLKESWRDSRRRDSAIEDLPARLVPMLDPEKERDLEQDAEMELHRLECMRQCLQSLPLRVRQFLFDYHLGEKRHRIENRQRLAEQLGVSPNTLRIRAHRIRRELMECARKCLKRRGNF